LCTSINSFIFSQSSSQGGESDSQEQVPATASGIEELQEVERSLTFDYGETPAAAPQTSGVGIFAMLRVILVLALVAAAIYGLIYILKRSKAAGTPPPDPFLKVLAITPLTPRSAAAVIGLGDKAWLVGIGDNSVSTIAELADKETIDAMRLASSEKEAATRYKTVSFKDILSKLTGTKKTAPNGADNVQPGALTKQRKRLQGL
jgi:flagellar protein FliO/FliZ